VVRPELGPGERLVMTIDVVTPMTNDPEDFGRIAAANALSDVYAMGGTPKVALGFIGFPADVLDLGVLRAVMRGLASVCREAGCAIVGGHTIVDPEPKAGLAVTGVVAGDRAWTHRRAQAGQVLVLTKGIGTGIIVQAIKQDRAPDEVARAAVAQMRALNARARDLGLEAGATAATDVTGFGLLGHLRHVAEASGVCAVVSAADVPLLPAARDLAEAGCVPGGTRKNLRYVEPVVRFAGTIDETTRLVLADAQTSGGLLLSVPEASAGPMARTLRDEGALAAVIGRLEPRSEDGVTIVVE
jgi:selenide,water dikinase